MDIKNKVAFVTGGVGSMRSEAVKALLCNGAKFVAIIDLVTSDGERLTTQLREDFGKDCVNFYPCDVTVRDELEENFNKVVEEYGNIDIVINGAEVTMDKDIQRLIDVNVTAICNLTLLAISHMGKHNGGKGGVIVNINSIIGLIDCPMLPFYSATKSSIIGLTRCMKENFATTGVRVVALCAGVTRTKFFDQISDQILDFVSEKITRQTFHDTRAQSPKDVGHAVIEIIQRCDSGDVWVVEHGKKPYAIKRADHYRKLSVSTKD